MNTDKFLEMLTYDKNSQNCKYFNGAYRHMVELIGVEAVIKIHTEYGGGCLSLPKNLLSLDYVYQCIINEYDGTNARELAKRLNCTHSWVLKIVKNKKSKKNKENEEDMIYTKAN